MRVDLLKDRPPLGRFDLRRPVHAIVFFFPVVFHIVNFAIYTTAPDWYREKIAAEDRLLENVQAICFALAAVMAIVMGVRLRIVGRFVVALLYGLLGAAMLFGFLEEISWGQRLFNFTTPDFMLLRSVQEETNFHNLQGVHQSLGWVGFVFSMTASFAWMLIPKTALRWRGGFLAYLVPGPLCILYFLQSAVYAAFLVLQENFVSEPILKVAYQELFETPLAMGFVVFLAFNMRRLRRGAEAEAAPL